MRKIKITALLLAVLMIVAAFAGCANKSTVDELKEQIKDLQDALENQGSDTPGDNKDVEDKVDGVVDALTGKDEAVKAARSEALAEISKLQATYAANSVNYKADDYAAILLAFGEANNSVATSLTVEAAKAVVTELNAKLANYVAVNDSIYALYVALKGNLTEDTAEAIDAAKEALDEAIEFYTEKNAATTPLTKYEYAEKKYVDLKDQIETKLPAEQTLLDGYIAQAKTITENITKALESYNKTDIENLLRTYDQWKKDLAKVSKLNPDDYVANRADLDVALESADNVRAALADIKSYSWEYPSVLEATYGTSVWMLADIVALYKNGTATTFVYATKDENGDTISLLTSALYAEMDARIEDFKAEYDLGDETFKYVIDKTIKDTEQVDNFSDLYAAGKALVAAFEADYKTLSEGAFASIKKLNTTKVNAQNAQAAADSFEANAKAILDWKKGLEDAYAELYKNATAEEAAVMVAPAAYNAIVLANFNAMVVEAKLCKVTSAVNVEPVTYAPYTDGFNNVKVGESNYNFKNLYNFTTDYAATETFLVTAYPQVATVAKTLNDRINGLVVDLEISTENLLKNFGGYFYEDSTSGNLVAYTDTAIKNLAANATPATTTTIALFKAVYSAYGLEGMVDEAAYEAKLAEVEAKIAAADGVAKAAVDAYNKLLAGTAKKAVVVTTENVADVLALEAHHDAWIDINPNFEVAVLNDDDEYEYKSVLAKYAFCTCGNHTADADVVACFNAKIMGSTDYTAATAANDTGAITRLIYQAKQLEKQANAIATGYSYIKTLDGKGAYAYANNTVAVIGNVAKGAVTAANFALLGAVSEPTKAIDATSKIITYTAEVLVFNTSATFGTVKVTGEGDLDDAKALANLAKKIAAGSIGAKPVSNVAPTADAIVAYLFGDAAGSLQDLIKTTEFDKLATNAAIKDKYIPAYVLPMFVSYLEAKFTVNNMGKESATVTAAKNDFGKNAAFGLDYTKAMAVLYINDYLVANQQAALNTKQTDNIKAAATFDALNGKINVQAPYFATNHGNLAFGGADSSWLAKTHDIEYIRYYNGETSVDSGIDYADLDITKTDIKAAGLRVFFTSH